MQILAATHAPETPTQKWAREKAGLPQTIFGLPVIVEEPAKAKHKKKDAPAPLRVGKAKRGRMR